MRFLVHCVQDAWLLFLPLWKHCAHCKNKVKGVDIVSMPTDNISLPIILAWFRANLRKIVLGGLVFVLLAVPIAFFRPKTYESTVTLLVFPPTFKEQSVTLSSGDPSLQSGGSIATMMPRALPVEAYKMIALSPAVLAEVIHQVPLENTTVRALEDRIKVELVQMGSRGAQGIVYTRALVFRGNAKSPELAANTVETWAKVFKEQVDGVAEKGIGETFTILDTLHSDTKTELEKADLALAEHVKIWNLDLVKAQLEAKQKEYTEFEGTLKKTEVKLASGEMKLKVLEEEFAKEPPKNVYFRAPSDDAYWITATQNGGKPKIQPDQGLRTEKSNPTYEEVRLLVVDEKEDLEGLKAKREAILLKVDELKKEMEALTATLADKTVERDKLTRESESLKANYAVVRSEYMKGRMANLTKASDIVITGKAVVPDSPDSRGRVKIILLAAFAGMFLTGGFLLLREISEMVPLLGPGGLRELMARASGSASDELPAKPGATTEKKENPEEPA